VTTLRPSSGTLGAQKTVGAARPTAHGAPLAATHASGELPFTGAQLAIFTIVGLALIGGGVLLRSSGRSRNTA
jgi:LPXTG-motif cell wall-anchored protein